MKIGVLKEEKLPADKRVPLTPIQCKKIIDNYPNVKIVIKSCDIRCFSDELYIKEGIEVVNDLDDCDVLLGVKEVPVDSLIANKTYLYFSHIIKAQPYNRSLLLKMLELNIRMIDYEVIKDLQGRRLIGFGKFAGIVGAYNTFLTYGLKMDRYYLKPAYKCFDRIEIEKELHQVKLNREKIIVTGHGRVGQGILEIIKKLNIREVSVAEFLNNEFDEPVFVHLKTMDYNIRKDSQILGKEDFYNNPSLYRSSFMKYVEKADIFIAGHFYSTGSPYLFTREDAKSSLFNLKVIGDISCDINGPVASTVRSSTIQDPIYGYNVNTESEDNFKNKNVVAVMAVDNLPCELPRDSSEYFGDKIIEELLPLLINDQEKIIERATICQNGNLTPYFAYLQAFVGNG